MENLTLEQVSELLATATITETHDYRHAIVHTGITEVGIAFVLINDFTGNSCVSYGM